MKYSLCFYYDVFPLTGLDRGLELQGESDKKVIAQAEKLLQYMDGAINPFICKVILFKDGKGEVAHWVREFKRVT